MIRMRTAGLIALTLLCAGVPRGAAAQAPDEARFRVQIWGELSDAFVAQMRGYASLRDELERGLAPREVTDDAAAILARTRALAARMRKARAGAKPGDIFTPAIAEKFRKTLQLLADDKTCASLLDDNPGALPLPINGAYPTHQPLSTMPANVLAALPPLPEDVEYPFAQHVLFLFDTRAGVVVDRMPSAMVCGR